MTTNAGPVADNRLSYTDQALFLGHRATGQEAVTQCVWVYEHPVDPDALRRFHGHLGYGLIGRRIERSPLPFGRHRWVSSLGPQTELDIAARPRSRDELSDWVDERALMPIDPERGPGWHLGVQPMTDGSTAVSLVVSHCLADGLGTLMAIVDGVKGNMRDLGYPPPRSRTRLRALADDARGTLRATPEIARTLGTATRIAYRRRHDFRRAGSTRASAPVPGAREPVVVPSVSVFIPLDEWDARAAALGGTAHALIAGYAARLSQRMGRCRADGAVVLNIPISERTADDTRANAVALADVPLDPGPVSTDLSEARTVIRQALTTLRDDPDETLELLPLTPFVPKRAVRRGATVVFGFTDLPVSCSNLGEIDPAVPRADGTDAEYVLLRGVDRHVTREFLERRPGLLTLIAGRVGDKMSMTVVGYRAGARDNTKAALREFASGTLADFGLTGTVF